LTYLFSGYTAAASGTGLSFTGGLVQFYVDFTSNFDPLSANSAGNGVLWLTLEGRNHQDLLTGVDGTLHSTATPILVGAAGNGRGFLDVKTGVGLGVAQDAFNTNTRTILEPDGVTLGKADFQFTSSFQLLPNGAFVSDDGRTYSLFGSNDLQGNAVVPEPGTLALLGLGIVGLVAARRRKSV
jgi:hypothetical protein